MELLRLDDYQSWCVTCGDQRLIIDPWLCDDMVAPAGERYFHRRHRQPIALRPSEIGAPDIIVLTSAHYDHAHVPTLKALDKHLRVIGPPSAIRLARELGFRSTIAIGARRTVILDGHIALTGVRPGFPYSMSSVGLVMEDKDDGTRIYLETHVPPFFDASLEQGVDVLLAPVEQVRMLGVKLALDADGTVALARKIRAKAIVPTGTGPDLASGLIPERLLKVSGSLETFTSVARLEAPDTRVKLMQAGERMRFKHGSRPKFEGTLADRIERLEAERRERNAREQAAAGAA